MSFLFTVVAGSYRRCFCVMSLTLKVLTKFLFPFNKLTNVQVEVSFSKTVLITQAYITN